MKKLLGLACSLGVVGILLGSLTGCPDTKTKTTDTKKVVEEKTDAGTKKVTEEKKTEEKTKKDS